VFYLRWILEKIEKKISALMNLQRLHEIQEAVVWPVFGDMDKKNEIPEVSFNVCIFPYISFRHKFMFSLFL